MSASCGRFRPRTTPHRPGTTGPHAPPLEDDDVQSQSAPRPLGRPRSSARLRAPNEMGARLAASGTYDRRVAETPTWLLPHSRLRSPGGRTLIEGALAPL